MLRPHDRLFLHLKQNPLNAEAEKRTVGDGVAEGHKRTWFNVFALCVHNSHLWLGFVTSNELSVFSKQERLACLLLSYLTISAVHAFITGDSAKTIDADAICIKHLCITWSKVIGCLKASLLAYILSTVFCFLFEITCHYEAKLQQQQNTSCRSASSFSGSSVKNGTGRAMGFRVRSRDRRKYIQKRKYSDNYSMRLLSKKADMLDDLKNNYSLKPRADGKYNHKVIELGNTLTRTRNAKLSSKRRKNGVAWHKLDTIREGMICEYSRSKDARPAMPTHLKSLQQTRSYLPKYCLNIEWVLVLVSSLLLAYLVWLQSLTWTKRQLDTWLASVVVSVSIDACLLQFLRPVFRFLWIGIKQRHSKHEVNVLNVVHFHRCFWHDIRLTWTTVNSPPKRGSYLESLQNIQISMPLSIACERQKIQAVIAKKKALKSLPSYILFFLCLMLVGRRGIQRYTAKEYIESKLIVSTNDNSSSYHSRGWKVLSSSLFPSQHSNANGTGRKWHYYQQQHLDSCKIVQHVKPSLSTIALDYLMTSEDRGQYDISWKKHQATITNISLPSWKYQAVDKDWSWIMELFFDSSHGYVAWLTSDSWLLLL
eukprot:gene18942-20847_t